MKVLKVNRQSSIIPDVPTDGEYIERIYRLTSVGFCAQDGIEFSEEVLREALPMFQPHKDAAGKEAFLTVFANHSRKAEAWLGQVREAWFIPASEAMPAGIDGLVRLFRKSDPRIILGVETGVLTAGSISFVAEVEDSHDIEGFDSKIGDKAPDGSIYRYIAERIVKVNEFSIVWMGADPTALNLDRAVETETINQPIDPLSEEENIIMDLKALIDLLKLAPEATPEDVSAAIVALMEKAASAEESAVAVENAKVSQAETARQLSQLKAEILVDSFGVKPESRNALVERAIDSYESVKLALESVPRAVVSALPPQGVGKAALMVADVTPSVVLTAQQKKVCRQLNISEAQYIKTLNK